jgi:hypothetical protein
MADPIACLTNPDEFFAEYVEESGLVAPALVVVSLALLSGLSGYLVFSQMQQLFTGGASTIVLVSTVLGALVGPLIMWLVYAAVFFGLSIVFGGDGGFNSTLGVVGWGFLPQVFLAVLSLGFTYFALQGMTVPQSGGPQAYAEFARQLQQQPIVRASGVLRVVFLLWQGVLWTYGIKHARELDLRDAAITVGIPVGVMLLWNVYNLLP